MELHELELKSIQYRRTILSIIKRSGAGHTGGSLSCIDILNVLYNQVMNVTPENFTHLDHDRYIHSKGHSVEALYTVLADTGFFPLQELETLERYGSKFIGHPTRKVNGIEQNTGALGHGLSFAVGVALAGKKDGRSYRVFTTLGDGELTEGSVWEASMSAAHYKLDNLVVIIDRNTLQITGRTEDVMALEPLGEFEKLPFEPGKPSLVIAYTTKGKGVSFMENSADWHHHVPTDPEFSQALLELDQAEGEWQERHGLVRVG
jgi:transketolase